MNVEYGITGWKFCPRWYAKYNGRTTFTGRKFGRNRALREALKHANLLNDFHKVV